MRKRVKNYALIPMRLISTVYHCKRVTCNIIFCVYCFPNWKNAHFDLRLMNKLKFDCIVIVCIFCCCFTCMCVLFWHFSKSFHSVFKTWFLSYILLCMCIWENVFPCLCLSFSLLCTNFFFSICICWFAPNKLSDKCYIFGHRTIWKSDIVSTSDLNRVIIKRRK